MIKSHQWVIFGWCVPEFIVEGRVLFGRRGRVVGDRAAAGLLSLLISVQSVDILKLNVLVLRGYFFPRKNQESEDQMRNFHVIFSEIWQGLVSTVPTRTSVKFEGLTQDPCKETLLCFQSFEQIKAPRTYRQTSEPSMFTKCLKLRSQLCSKSNFPIWLPVFYRKSYTIAGPTALNSSFGHLITKAELTMRAI